MGSDTTVEIKQHLEIQFNLDTKRSRYKIIVGKKYEQVKEKQYKWSPTLKKAGDQLVIASIGK